MYEQLLHSHESLIHISSLPLWFLPLARRFTMVGSCLLGRRIRLKICLPVHMRHGYQQKYAHACECCVWIDSMSTDWLVCR